MDHAVGGEHVGLCDVRGDAAVVVDDRNTAVADADGEIKAVDGGQDLAVRKIARERPAGHHVVGQDRGEPGRVGEQLSNGAASRERVERGVGRGKYGERPGAGQSLDKVCSRNRRDERREGIWQRRGDLDNVGRGVRGEADGPARVGDRHISPPGEM